jgi:hypothetical protein
MSVTEPLPLAPFVDTVPVPQRLVAAQHHGQLTVRIRAGRHRFHRDLPPSMIWGYDGSVPGPTIDTERLTALVEHLRSAADLDSARSPGVNRREVVDHEGDAWVGQNIAVLLARGEGVAADVNAVLFGVVAEADGHHVGLSVRASGRDATETLASQILDLLLGECAHLDPQL